MYFIDSLASFVATKQRPFHSACPLPCDTASGTLKVLSSAISWARFREILAGQDALS